MKNRIFAVLLKRAFCSPLLYCSIAMFPVLLQIPLSGLTGKVDQLSAFHVLDWAMMGNMGIFMFLLCLLPAVPFTQSVVDDSDSNLIYLWAIRAGAESYAVAYFLTVLLTGFCTVFLGSVLSLGIMVASGYPLLPHVNQSNYADLLQNQPVRYILYNLVTWSLGGTAMAAIAAAAATVFRHKVAALASPVSVYIILVRLLDYRNPLNVNKLLSGGQTLLGNSPNRMLLGQILLAVVYCTICGCVVVYQIKRRVNHG